MKKRQVIIVILSVLMFSCAPSENLVKRQAYNQAIDDLVPRILQGKDGDKNISLLKTAYHESNQIDHERIMELKQSGEVDIWPEIYRRLQNIQTREERLKPLSNEIKERVGYNNIDLSTDIAAAKNKSELYFKAQINRLLATNNKNDAVEAQKLIHHLEQMDPSYTQLKEMKFRATLQGADYVLICFDNASEKPIPKGFTAEILDFYREEINQNYINYDIEALSGKRYNSFIWLIIDNIDVTPERLQSASFDETNEGFTAKVTEFVASKTASLTGRLVLTDKNGSIKYTQHIESSSAFSHSYATIEGDKRACSEQTLALLNVKPVRIPQDEILILDATKQFNRKARQIIWK